MGNPNSFRRTIRPSNERGRPSTRASTTKSNPTTWDWYENALGPALREETKLDYFLRNLCIVLETNCFVVLPATFFARFFKLPSPDLDNALETEPWRVWKAWDFKVLNGDAFDLFAGFTVWVTDVFVWDTFELPVGLFDPYAGADVTADFTT